MCIMFSKTLHHLHVELGLVLDQYVYLILVDDYVDFEITFIGFSLKN